MQSGKVSLQQEIASLSNFDDSTSAVTNFQQLPFDPKDIDMRLDDVLAFPDIPDDIATYQSEFPENPSVAKLAEQLVASQASRKNIGRVNSRNREMTLHVVTTATEADGDVKGAKKRVLRREASLTINEGLFADSPRTLAMHLLENDVPMPQTVFEPPAATTGTPPPMVLPTTTGHGSTGKKARGSPKGSLEHSDDADELLITARSAPGNIVPSAPRNFTEATSSATNSFRDASHANVIGFENDLEHAAPVLTANHNGPNNSSFSGTESAEDLVMRRRLQNRAASARHRQRIKEREGELVTLRQDKADLVAEKDAMAAQIEELQSKLREAESRAAAAEAATEKRAQEASEQALLYVVGKYWLRQKLHFPTVASCVRGLVSLSIEAQNRSMSSNGACSSGGAEGASVGMPAEEPVAEVSREDVEVRCEES